MADPRRTFVIEELTHSLAVVSSQSNVKAALERDPDGAIGNFLDSSSVTVLQATVERGGTVRLSIKVAYDQADGFSVLLTKIKPGVVEEKDLPHGLVVSSVSSSPLSSLYHSLKNVYSPLFQGKMDGVPDPKKLQGLMAELEAGLGSLLRRGEGAGGEGDGVSAAQDPDHAALLGILTPSDEFRLWAELSENHRAPGSLQRRAKSVYKCFEPVRPLFDDLRSQGQEAVLDLVDTCHDSLERVWEVESADNADGYAYAQPRMVHLLKIIGEAFLRYLESQFDGVNVWSGSFQAVESRLRYGLRLIGRWEKVKQDLTGITWLRHRHQWNAKLEDVHMIDTNRRIDQVLKMKEVYQELSKLLSDDEARTLQLAEVFTPFYQMNPLYTSEYTEPLWRAAMADFEQRMVPIEMRISQKLRELFGSVLIPSLSATVGSKHSDRGAGALAEAHQVLYELQRYKELMSRPVIAEALSNERTNLHKQMMRHLENLRADFESRSDTRLRGGGEADNASTTGRNMPRVLDDLTWAIQCEEKLAQTTATFDAVQGLSQAGGGLSEQFDALSKDLQRDIETFKKGQFSNWQQSLHDRLSDFRLDKNSKLMDLDTHSGHVKLHYNSQLVELLREVRQLVALGFNIRRDVVEETNTARQFYRHGMVLKQVANFYNDISTQMIRCQKTMMLEDAKAFEHLLSNPKDGLGKIITWGNPVALEGYIQRLQGVANGLTDKNRRLRKWHRVLGEKVCDMMNLDLVRQRDRWARGVKELREVFTKLEKEGFSELAQQTWRHHWDYQIYKVLECQYSRGLECLNETLPQMEVKLVFKQKRLQFEPPLEEIRTQHYKNIKAFLNLPLSHKGVSDLSQKPGFFRHMVDKNALGVAKVYEHAEVLFARLGEEQKKLSDWVVLGTVDLDEFCDNHLDEVADWENNFRMLKGASKDAEKLPNEAKIDCYMVNIAPTKAAIEEHLKKLQECLVTSLKRAAQLEKDAVEAFIAEGKTLLEANASSAEEIGQARQGAKGLINTVQKMMALRRRVDEKNKLLKNVAGSNQAQQQNALVDTSALTNEWDNFTQKLQQHESHLEEQTGQLVGKVQKTITEFQSKVDSFAARWHELKPRGAPQGDPQLMLNKMEDDHRMLKEMEEEAEKIRLECEHFSIDPPDFSALVEAGQDIESTRQSWSRYGEFAEERKQMGEKDWISFRKNHFQLEDMLAKWGDSVKGSQNKDAVAILLLQEIEKYRKSLPYLKYVRGDGWERNHWVQLFNLLGMPTKGPNAVSVETLTVDHFLDKADMLAKHGEQVKQLHAQAQGEVTLREALRQLQVWGLERQFTLLVNDNPSSSGKAPVSLIREWKELMTEVADHQSLVGSLKESPFFAPFKEETSVWESRLATLNECCMHLNSVQRKWVYLEPIFARGALPHEQPRFKRVDDDFRSIMKTVSNDPLVVSFADIPRLKDTLPQMSNQLDICQRALSDFLEDKRSYFPRFYFIGDDDLLEILGQAKNPEVIQTHLKKLFAGIHKVVFGEGNRTITGMLSMAGEVVPLNEPVPVDEAVEMWLGLLAKAMVETLSSALVQCISMKDYQKFPSQVLSIADMVHFTQKCESALPQGKLPAFRESLLKQLEEYTSYDSEGHRVMQLKLQSLVLDLIHNIDIVDQLIAEGGSQLSDWSWHKQLRYYAKGSQCTLLMAEALMDYSFEYQGNAPKLVYTPLTDKCYLTLTQGMQLGYGGNPYGPAGTGKTESVKALGQCLGRQVLVFNCDEEFDFKSMGRIFMGLIKCGAWGCFDEFNRLEEEVLSAVSQQIQVIQHALKERSAKLDFMSKQVDVDHRAGIFVTLNPAGKGYGGRSKLPDNLKQLFRSVAMTAPDNDLIAEVLLLSEGFKHARELGRKIVSLFLLCRQLLSPQQHYDWGLRALKTVLGIAGKLLSEARSTKAAVAKEGETDFCIRAMRVTTLPKLTFDDSSRFGVLLTDVFPGVAVSDVTDEALAAAVRTVLGKMRLELVTAQTDKMLQMHLACSQRIGVIVVGPSGSGKTTLWRVLEAAYKELGRPVKVHVMNPKAVPRQQLLGHMDMDTREWFDGILTAAARQVVKEPLEQHSWIICDGDVDPEWIESLNSVLDDNRLLTLPSGERIQFGPNVNFIFECHDLRFASPATVSRAGMIFLSEENIDVEVMLKAWLGKVADPDQRDRLKGWLDDFFPRAFELALQKPNVVDTTKAGTLYNGLSHLVDVDSKRDFCCKLARGFGANMDEDTMAEFMAEMSRALGEAELQELPATMAAAGGMTDSGLVLVEQVNQTLRTIQPWVESGEPFILVGPEGCGKATLLQHAFSQQKSTSLAVINCSAQTSALHAMQKLTQVCGQPVSTNEGRVLRPRDAEKLVIYFKDLNLPKPDKYDTIQLISFLQQLVTFRGYYDENLEFIGLEPGRIQIVGSMNPSTTVGRHVLTSRFTAIVRVACTTYPERTQLQTVYFHSLKRALADHPTHGSDSQIRKLAGTMIEIYDTVAQTFSADDYRHYKLTPRHLSEWVAGLERYDMQAGADIMDVFAYEAARVFRDRLVGTDAQDRFDSLVTSSVRSQWRATLNPEALFTTWAAGGGEAGDAREAPELVPMSRDDFHDFVAGKLVAYEREVKDLNILLFPEVLERLAEFDRVLSRPQGSLLLVGRSGVGRRSTLTLATYIHRMELVTPNMTRGYNLKAFRTDLKNVLVRAGVEGERVVFHIEDHQLVEPTFLEIVNSLLSSGEIPGLFSNEELDGLMAPLRDEMSNQFVHKSLFAYFSARVKHNLHVAISMDPANPQFAMRCESNPALFNRCNIFWQEAWSANGLSLVPEKLLHDVLEASAEDMDAELVPQIVSMQEMAGGTPRQYVAFVSTYRRIFTEKREQLLEQISFLQAGLNKLGEAEAKVDELSQQAGKQRSLLGEKQAQAEQALQQITVAMQRASSSKTEVEVLQKKLAEEEVQLNSRKGSVELELADVEPLVAQAKKAVGSIKSDNINEIRSLKMPPDAIRDVLEGVLVIMGNPDTSWNNMKKFLGSRQVKDELINFDARKITAGIRNAVNKLLTQKAQSFEHQVIYRVSVAAAPLAAWVKANVKFSMVLEKIEPLEEELSMLQSSLDQSKARLIQCEDDLRTLDEQVTTLKDDFGSKTRETETLKMSLKSATDQLEAAESLLSKLGGEKGRWEEQVRALEQSLLELPLNSLVSSGFITYLAQAPEETRRKQVESWCKAINLHEFSFTQFMSSESEMLKWKAEGLPSDGLSMENAVILLKSIQVPYIIDPSTKATQWLKGHIKTVGATLDTTTIQDSRFATNFELAVRFGKTLVVDEVDSLEAILYTVLRRDLLRQGTRMLVQIGDKTVDYNENFRLYLSTRNPYPTVPPDAASLVGITNFSITHSGLESQLLGITIQHEKPELEQQKTAILKEEEDLKVQLADLEKMLLKTLATSEGNILENKKLIDALSETKEKSNTIQQGLEKSAELQMDLDSQRNVYQPIAQEGSQMFFLMRDLRALNHMYQFSLNLFVSLFKQALATETPGGDTSVRINMLTATLLSMVFAYTSRSLFKADRLTFGMHFVKHLRADHFDAPSWDYFLGVLVESVHGGRAQAKPEWVPQELAGAFTALATSLPQLHSAFDLGNVELWRGWMSSTACEAHFPPGRHNPFHQLLITQAFRPDRLEVAMSNLICKLLEVKSISPPSMSLQRVYESESSASEPVLFITTPGADPSQELQDFAERIVGKARYHQVAMGQGQAEVAMNLLRQCAKNGDWLCLKNIHLVVSWLPTLEKEVYMLTPHPEFRLFLTAESHDKFPSSLLESSLKITFESPPGTKMNLKRTYEQWTQEYISSGQPVRAQVMFLLAWFHAVVQERRNFVPQGWSKFYEFSFADLRSGADIIDLTTRNGRAPQWKYIVGLLENAIYGGRVDNPYDIQVMRTYLHQFFSADMVSSASGSRAKVVPGARDITLPTSTHLPDFLSIITQLPDTDEPGIFSMPANANRTVQEANSTRVLVQLKTMATAASTAKRFDRELWSRQLAPVLKLWERLVAQHPQLKKPLNAREVDMRSFKTPVDTFVAMEYIHGRALMSLLERGIGSVARVLKGTQMLTPAIQDVATALLRNEVPGPWDSKWEGPEDPIQYVRSAVSRLVEVERMFGMAGKSGLMESGTSINLGHMYHADTFLNALRQQTARALDESMDNLRLVTTWDASYNPGHNLGASIAGLMLQGAGFNGKKLQHLSADAASAVMVPDVMFLWAPKSKPMPYPNCLATPLYRSQDRSKVLFEVQLPLAPGEDQSSWILSGVALFVAS